MSHPESAGTAVQERFVEGDEHTVIDLKRKLVWLKKDTYQLAGKWLNWVQARDYAKELNQSHYAGYNDWRMPTLEEAKSLYNKNQVNKDYMGQKAYLHPLFAGGFGFLCWTADVRNKIQAVRFGYRKGGMMYDDVYRVSRGSTRLVRDMNKVQIGRIATAMGKRFIDNGDGTVTDTEEGLMWKQTDGFQDESIFHTWFKAQDYIRELNNKKFAGYNDWRMPNLEEAESLFLEDVSIRDCDRFEIFIDKAFSPGGGYTTWTSDLKPHNGAVIFYYRYGHANVNNRDDPSKDSIRAVRTIAEEE